MEDREFPAGEGRCVMEQSEHGREKTVAWLPDTAHLRTPVPKPIPGMVLGTRVLRVEMGRIWTL